MTYSLFQVSDGAIEAEEVKEEELTSKSVKQVLECQWSFFA